MVDTTPRRRKRSGYPERLSLQVTPAMKRALEDMADRLELDVAEIGRRAIEAGLPGLAPPIIAVEALVPDVQPEPVSAEEVRVWWDGLTHRARTRWGKRLHHIDDVAAFRAEAYRQAQGGKAHMKDNILLAQQFSASGDHRRALEIIESLRKKIPGQAAQTWLRYHKAIFLLRSDGLEAVRDLAMSVLDSSINNEAKINLRARLLTRMSEANDVDGLAKLLPAQILADKIRNKLHRDAMRIQKRHGLVPDSEPITLGETPPSQSVFSERRISYGAAIKPKNYPPSIKMGLDGNGKKYATPVKLYILTNCTAIYWNGYSFFFDAVGGFIRECSDSIPDSLNGKIQDLLKAPPPAITGVSAYICDQYSGGNYCHWILDWLPRLSLCERAGPFENIVCGKFKHDFMQESLDFVGYQDKTIIVGGGSLRVWRFETLLVPDNGLVRNLCHPMHFCHPDLLQWWRSRLSARKPHRKLYIPRKNTRFVRNEADLLNLLDGFESFDPGRHSFKEQMRIFSEAEMVVGAHGAGLTNLLFAPEGCQVLELFPPYMGTAAFFNLATALNHDYDLAMAEGSPPRPDEWRETDESSFIVPMKQVEQWLQGKA